MHNSFTKILPFALFIGFLFCSCASDNYYGRHIKDVDYYNTCNPPGGVKIADNFYYDESEVTNINYLEFLFWTKRVYGDSSIEYKSALPDTLVWRDTAYLHRITSPGIKYLLENNYLKGVKFENYPLVGITQEQAKTCTKWRSDRVMEFILVANNEIKWDPNPTKDSCFTIERYYSGQYKNITPKDRFSYYPDFRLPTVDEWRKAVRYDDSLAAIKPNIKVTASWIDISPCKVDTEFYVPTEKVTGTVNPKKGSPIYNLLDNVSEWTADSGVCVGGSWHDKKEIVLNVLKQDTFHRTKPNAWTGFRNVCQWKKWDGSVLH